MVTQLKLSILDENFESDLAGRSVVTKWERAFTNYCCDAIFLYHPRGTEEEGSLNAP